jgi:hypothetical protein
MVKMTKLEQYEMDVRIIVKSLPNECYTYKRTMSDVPTTIRSEKTMINKLIEKLNKNILIDGKLGLGISFHVRMKHILLSRLEALKEA